MELAPVTQQVSFTMTLQAKVAFHAYLLYLDASTALYPESPQPVTTAAQDTIEIQQRLCA